MSKEAMRARFPTIADVVDEYRHFLERVIYAEENGVVAIDRREPVDPDCIFQIPKGYAPMRAVPVKERK